MGGNAYGNRFPTTGCSIFPFVYFIVTLKIYEEESRLCEDDGRPVTEIKQEQDDGDWHISHEHKVLVFKNSNFLDVGSLFEVPDTPVWDNYYDEIYDASEAKEDGVHKLDSPLVFDIYEREEETTEVHKEPFTQVMTILQDEHSIVRKLRFSMERVVLYDRVNKDTSKTKSFIDHTKLPSVS